LVLIEIIEILTAMEELPSLPYNALLRIPITFRDIENERSFQLGGLH
jgi:hypothetical protein